MIFPRRPLFAFVFVFGLLATSPRPLEASVLGSFTITESVASLPSYYPAQYMTTGWAGIFLDNTSTPIVVAGLPISNLPTAPYTVALLPGNAAFDAVNTALHQPNGAFNHSVLTYADVYSTDGAGPFWQGQGDLAAVLTPGLTDLIGYTLTEIDVTLSNMSAGAPQPYPGGSTTFRFSVTENITLQGYLGAPPAVPEPGTLALRLQARHLC